MWMSLLGKVGDTHRLVSLATLTSSHHHGSSRRVHEVPLAAGVALCQQGNGLQLQRQEEIHHMEEAVDLPG